MWDILLLSLHKFYMVKGMLNIFCLFLQIEQGML